MEIPLVFIFIFIFVIAIPILKIFFDYYQYKKSNYRKQTNNSFISVCFDKGLNGEYHLYRCLSYFESIGCRFLFNLYVPISNDKTSEVDIILFHPKGLFVIESKNYSGWIYGNEYNKQWTQTLPINYGESNKARFYNPIMQNAAHIRAIRKHIDDTIPIYSVIAFSDDSTLKNVTVKSDVIVTYYSKIQKEIQYKLSTINHYSMTPELFNETYNKLLQYANADEITKYKHIYNN